MSESSSHPPSPHRASVQHSRQLRDSSCTTAAPRQSTALLSPPASTDDAVPNALTTVASCRGGEVAPLRGVASLFGGVLAHLVLGTLYCWGNFISYAPESLKYFDGLGSEAHGGATSDAVSVMPLTIVFQCIGLKFGGSLIKM